MSSLTQPSSSTAGVTTNSVSYNSNKKNVASDDDNDDDDDDDNGGGTKLSTKLVDESMRISCAQSAAWVAGRYPYDSTGNGCLHHLNKQDMATTSMTLIANNDMLRTTSPIISTTDNKISDTDTTHTTTPIKQQQQQQQQQQQSVRSTWVHHEQNAKIIAFATWLISFLNSVLLYWGETSSPPRRRPFVHRTSPSNKYTTYQQYYKSCQRSSMSRSSLSRTLFSLCAGCIWTTLFLHLVFGGVHNNSQGTFYASGLGWTTTTVSRNGIISSPTTLSPGTTHGIIRSSPVSSSFSSFQRLVLFMGKGDGKKKRPKKNKKKNIVDGTTIDRSTNTQSNDAADYQRVSTDINVPIRRQIMYGKINKAYRDLAAKQNGGGPTSFRQNNNNNNIKYRTKYRRSWNETQVEEAALKRKRKGGEVNWDEVLNQTLWNNPPFVVVDGYNIIMGWRRLKKHMVRGDLERARTLLCDDLEDLAEMKGWQIEVVFDAAEAKVRTAGPGLSSSNTRVVSTMAPNQRLAPTKQILKHGRVQQVFTGRGIEADTYIEQRCMQAKNQTQGQTTSQFIVATDDNMIRVAASSAGALLMGTSRFIEQLKANRNIITYNVQQVNKGKLWDTNKDMNGNRRRRNGDGQDNDNDDYINDPILGQVRQVQTDDGRSVYVPRFQSSISRNGVIIEVKKKKNKNNKNKNKNRTCQGELSEQQEQEESRRNHSANDGDDSDADDNNNDNMKQRNSTIGEDLSVEAMDNTIDNDDSNTIQDNTKGEEMDQNTKKKDGMLDTTKTNKMFDVLGPYYSSYPPKDR